MSTSTGLKPRAKKRSPLKRASFMLKSTHGYLPNSSRARVLLPFRVFRVFRGLKGFRSCFLFM